MLAPCLKWMSSRQLAVETESEGLDDERVIFQLRLDSYIHRELKQAAETAGLGLNQLINGVCRCAAENLEQDEPIVRDGFVGVRKTRK